MDLTRYMVLPSGSVAGSKQILSDGQEILIVNDATPVEVDVKFTGLLLSTGWTLGEIKDLQDRVTALEE